MGRVWASCVILGLLSASCATAAWLPPVTGKFPSQDNDKQDCASADVLVPPGGLMVRGIFRWTGPSSWADTLTSTYGSSFTYPRRWAAPGTYTLTVTVADSVGNVSCPVTKTYKTKAAPSFPAVN